MSTTEQTTTHTPGPWSIIKSGDDYIIQETHRTRRKSYIAKAINQKAQANARLIAAAPELLTALRGLMTQAARDAEDYTEDDSAPIWAYIADAADALEKAQPGSTKNHA